MIPFNLVKAPQRVLRGKSLITYKKTLTLTTIQKDVIIGTLLGDASIPKQQKDANYSLKFEQTSRQKKYVWHLYELFQSFVGTPPKMRDVKGGGAKNRESIGFRTYRHIMFKFYYDLFYPVDTQNLNQRKKKVPKTIHKLLTPRALAYWYMDDGSWNKANKAYNFNTQSFSYSDICILKKTLKMNFNLDTNIYRDRTCFLLYIQPHCNGAFSNLIQPYLLDSFQYKLFLQTVIV